MAQKIGELNGWWALLFKAHLAAVSVVTPFGLGLVAWIVSECYENRAFRKSGERFSKEDARDLERSMLKEHELIKRDMVSRYESLEVRMSAIDRDTARILAILERLESKQGP